MANRQDFKRLEDGGKAGVFVGVLAAGAALGKKIVCRKLLREVDDK